MAGYVMDNVSAEEIAKLIGDVLGIPAAEEFYTKTEAPYAAVLTPAARVSAPDMGRYYARTQRYRIDKGGHSQREVQGPYLQHYPCRGV